MTVTSIPELTRPGARWWKVDFHAHSPASFDFGAKEGTRAISQTSYRDWLLAYMRSGIDALVIADHNSHTGIVEARAELERLRQERAPGFREIALLAGVELTVDGGFHLLAVFDVDTPSEQVNGLLHVCGYESERGSSISTTKHSFAEVVDEIVERNGLAIPAHADAAKGLFSHDERNQDSLRRSGKILAAEVVTEAGRSKATKAGWTSVLGSDAHHLDDSQCPEGMEAKFPGSHFTWVKMETPNLFGITLALSDGSQSVIPARLGDADQNEFSHATIDKLILRSGGSEATYNFGPWMNTIIGGRGVGKSTLIEVIRLAMGRFADLPKELQSDNDWFSPRPGSGTSVRFWDQGTEIEVYVSRLGRRYRVLWNGTRPADSRIEVWDEGAWVPEGGSPRDRFALLINSQKQIYETARDAQSLLNAIDDQPQISYAGWKKILDELYGQYRTQRSEQGELRIKIADEDRLRGELSDVEAELSQIAKLRDSEEARELDALVQEEQSFAEFEATAQRFEQALETSILDHEELATAFSDEGVSEAPESASWDPESQRRSSVGKAHAAAAAALKTLSESRALWETMAEQSPRIERINELNALLKPDAAANGDEDQPLASVRTEEPNEANSRLRTKKGELEAELREIEKARTRESRLSKDASYTLERIVEHRALLTRRRAELANSLSGRDLKLKVLAQADEGALEADLRELLRKHSAFGSVFAGLIGTLKHPFQPGRDSRIAELKTLLKELHTLGEDSPKLAQHSDLSIEQRFFKHLETLDTHTFYTDVDLWFPEDRLRVQYRPDGSNSFQEIDQGSPGQKTAALLAVVLQLSNDPLLLDQPEDDLDNKLIYDLVVTTLKRIKSERQIIAVTHNANVVVNADSEHVTILDHGPIPVVEASGAIQGENIKKSICLIMEGGESAFEARYQRLMR